MTVSISTAAFETWSANFLISSATTANPLPASPARADSIAAFNASKLVCLVISLMTDVKSTTAYVFISNSPMRLFAFSTSTLIFFICLKA